MTNQVPQFGEVRHLEEEFVPPTAPVDVGWFLIAGVLVFFMQSGFALLESGSVRFKNYQNILLKNCMDACIGGLVWWAWGYGLAFGNGTKKDDPNNNGFLGEDYFFGKNLSKDYQYHIWLFQYAFACTAATIVSGSLAERVNINAYLLFSFFITGWIYPVIVHWHWGYGWLSKIGYYDFAGSGIVHLTGGICGLTAAIICGPRIGRFKDIREGGDISSKRQQEYKVVPLTIPSEASQNVKATYSDVIKKFKDGDIDLDHVHEFVRKYQLRLKEQVISAHSPQQAVLGTLILWLGWLMFNGGSSLALTGVGAKDAALAMVNSIVAPSAAGIFTFYTRKHITGQKKDVRMDFQAMTNGILAGLVSITASCNIVEPYSAIIIAIIGSCIYSLSCRVTEKLQIDDPLEAFQVHGCCGAWGVLACAFFHIDKGIFYGGNESTKYLGAQVVGILAITSWSLFWSIVFCVIAKKFEFLRLSEEDEILGGDLHYFGPIEYHGDSNDLRQSFIAMNKKWELFKKADTKDIENPEEVNGNANEIEIAEFRNESKMIQKVKDHIDQENIQKAQQQ